MGQRSTFLYAAYVRQVTLECWVRFEKKNLEPDPDEGSVSDLVFQSPDKEKKYYYKYFVNYFFQYLFIERIFSNGNFIRSDPGFS